jgi:hypothetical protein
MKGARAARQIHEIIANEQLDEFDSVTAVVCLAKISFVDHDKDSWLRLYELVRSHTDTYGPYLATRALHGYARLTGHGLALSLVPLAALEVAVERVAPDMSSKQVAAAIWAYGAFKGPRNRGGVVLPTRRVIDELEAAIQRVVTDMNPKTLSTILMSYPKIGLRPTPSTLEALELVAERLVHEMTDPREVSDMLYGYANLGTPPAPAILDALVTAAERTTLNMVHQEVANILWSCAVFDRIPPPKVVEVACVLADRFTRKGLVLCFGAHLAEASAGRHLDIPAELLLHAESAWRSAVGERTTSDLCRDVSGTLTRICREHIFEGFSDDGLFRVDCLISNGQIAIEVDGPQPFVECVPKGSSLLRKRLLEARGFRVIVVPYYEWDGLRTDEDKQAYLIRLLDG